MPIELDALHTRFVVVPENILVREIVEALTSLPAEAVHRWYVVVRLTGPRLEVVPRADGGFETVEAPPPGYAVILPMTELYNEELPPGQSRLDTALRDVPELLAPALTLDRHAMGAGRARREWLPVSPRRRLVVMEERHIIGLLTDEERAGGFGGSMTTLFGREQPRSAVAQGRILCRCPVDGGVYDFSEIIDLATNRLVCPNGHVIEE